jgi:hypothetical protein
MVILSEAKDLLLTRLFPRRRALRARTNFPQIKPRIKSEIVIIDPGKFQRILFHRLGRRWPTVPVAARIPARSFFGM